MKLSALRRVLAEEALGCWWRVLAEGDADYVEILLTRPLVPGRNGQAEIRIRFAWIEIESADSEQIVRRRVAAAAAELAASIGLQ